MMGEHGAESVHKHFNILGRTHHGIPNSVERLKYMLKEHQLHTAPANVAARPPIRKRKLTTHPDD